MAASQGQHSRKLAVILHADVVGSTSLVQLNESLAHDRMTDAFNRFSQFIDRYGGNVHEIRGDALVAEFARASDAVCAVLAFQQSHAEYLAQLDDEIAPVIRTGVSLGEVVIADGTVTGAGVVLAQRIEQLAEPGGLCVTGAVHEALPQRMPFVQASLGEQQVKGFEDPVRVYRVALKPGEVIPPPEEIQQRNASNTLGISAAVAAIALVIAGGLAYWFQPWLSEEGPTSVKQMMIPLPDKPAIAVLPFANFSGNAEQDYFAAGITEDLITDLARFPALSVTSRTSSAAYKETTLDAREIGRELGVGYLLEGSVERTSDQLRITAQLIDASSGEHLWARRYDRVPTDLFAVRDEIRAGIIGSLTGQTGPLFTDEQRRAKEDDNTRLQARDLFYRAFAAHALFTKEGNNEARRLLQEMIAMDPADAGAYALLAWTHWRDVWVFGIDEPEASINQALAAAKKAATLDSNDYRGPWALGAAYRLLGDLEAAAVQYQRAYELNPHDPDLLADRGEFQRDAGDLEEAIASLERAMALNPHYPTWYINILTNTYLRSSRYQDAVEVASRVAEPNFYLRLNIAASHAHLGNTEKAKAVIDKILELDPEYSIAKNRSSMFSSQTPNEQLYEGLRKAGLPEE